MAADDRETILIVDDEEPVRKTFREWLTVAGLDCDILAAADAEAALQLANKHAIDLAILDWALGAGDDGLQLLQDLAAFHPDVVAIMVTGFANQATPLDAMRMGVRDYLDKNQDLSKDTFLHAVRRQLEKIRPAKRARRLHQTLTAFRENVEKILPLVQSTAALQEPVPLTEAVRGLMRFLLQATGAKAGVLLVRDYDSTRHPEEVTRAYDDAGLRLDVDLVPFARALAGTAVSMQETCTLQGPGETGSFELQPFEKGRQAILAAPMVLAPGVHAVIELLDKQVPGAPFSAADKRLAQAAANLGADLLKQALSQRHASQMLFDALAAALDASARMEKSLAGTPAERLREPPAPQVLEQLREGLSATSLDGRGGHAAEQSLRLAEAIRVLGLRHGASALEYCLRHIEETGKLLDQATIGGE